MGGRSRTSRESPARPVPKETCARERVARRCSRSPHWSGSCAGLSSSALPTGRGVSRREAMFLQAYQLNVFRAFARNTSALTPVRSHETLAPVDVLDDPRFDGSGGGCRSKHHTPTDFNRTQGKHRGAETPAPRLSFGAAGLLREGVGAAAARCSSPRYDHDSDTSRTPRVGTRAARESSCSFLCEASDERRKAPHT